jgi:MFS transporter, FHS family, glucose/mannose:H+ symporter
LKNRLTSILCMLSMALSAMVMTALSLMLPVLAGKLSVTIAESGAVFTANFLGFTIFVLLNGAMADRFGKKRMLTLSLLGLAVTSALIPFTGSFALLVFVVFLFGGCTGMAQIMGNALQADLHPDRPAYYINLNGVFFGIGAILAPLVSGLVSRLAQGYLYLFLTLTVLSLALVVALLFSSKQAESASIKLSWADVKALAANKRLWLVFACMFLYTGTEVSTWGWMSTFLKQQLGFSIFLSGVAVAVFWSSLTLGRAACGRLALRVSIPKLVSVLSASAFVVVLLSGFVSSAQVYWVVIALTGLSFSSMYPMLLSYGVEHDMPLSAQTAAYSVLMAGGSIGNAVIPWVAGVVGEKVGIQAAMMGPSALFLIILVIVFIVSRGDKRKALQLR